MPQDPEVDALLAEHTPDVAAAARRLRAAVLRGLPDLAERVRHGWHSINYRDPAAGFVCAIFPMADRVRLVFERGVLLPDPAGLLAGSGRQVRSLEFADASGVDDGLVQEFLDHAVAIGAGLRGL
ncbi:DUF1801 domain-containing protein [Blastococcus goldschmidtiae]|uniref:DUF1801 domain-containing protein n=1 Tax=Blastococcus goldschmidtiae TaxID=3075546 RepID=A0ABU2K2U3_9ACTN|nr:DUF1801 domain-containing protein [Blastococcus sp. DSM 46792]MDT0274507.1 DUF1801 domain-containing protein [Blastococcus sp. DSM 46792]